MGGGGARENQLLSQNETRWQQCLISRNKELASRARHRREEIRGVLEIRSSRSYRNEFKLSGTLGRRHAAGPRL